MCICLSFFFFISLIFFFFVLFLFFFFSFKLWSTCSSSVRLDKPPPSKWDSKQISWWHYSWWNQPRLRKSVHLQSLVCQNNVFFKTFIFLFNHFDLSIFYYERRLIFMHANGSHLPLFNSFSTTQWPPMARIVKSLTFWIVWSSSLFHLWIQTVNVDNSMWLNRKI